MILAVALAAVIGLAPWRAFRRAAARLASRRAGEADAAEYFDTVAREMRHGSSLRQALAMPIPGSRVERLALTGQPIEVVAAEVVSMLRIHDALPAAGIRLASRSGAPASKVFARLAEQAREAAQHERDKATATAQARLSAGVVGLVPLGLGLVTLALGGGRYVAQPGPARTAILIGVSLQIVGLVVIAGLLRRER